MPVRPLLAKTPTYSVVVVDVNDVTSEMSELTDRMALVQVHSLILKEVASKFGLTKKVLIVNNKKKVVFQWRWSETGGFIELPRLAP